jgi:hypothetical protein
LVLVFFTGRCLRGSSSTIAPCTLFAGIIRIGRIDGNSLLGGEEVIVGVRKRRGFTPKTTILKIILYCKKLLVLF